MTYPSVEKTIELLIKEFKPQGSEYDPNYLPGTSLLKTYELIAPKEIANCIVEISGAYKGHDSKNTILIEADNKLIPVMQVMTTYYSSPVGGEKKHYTKKGERLYIIAVEATNDETGDPVNVALTIIQETERHLFEQVKSLFGRAAAIRDFYNMLKDQPEKQRAIVELINASKYPRYDHKQDITFIERPEQLLKFALTREAYPVETQRALDEMFRLRRPGMNKSGLRLEYLSNICPEWKIRRPIDKEKFLENWHRTFYKLDLPAQIILDVLLTRQNAKKRGCRILFVGSPGVGKTSIMLFVAKECNIPAEIIPLSGVSHPIDLIGLTPQYSDAEAGKFAQVFKAHGTTEMVIGLDEIDKMDVSTKEGNPMNVLYDVLSGKLEDKFIGCPISTENTIFMATANSTEDIPEPILNRFDAVIRLDDYSVEDRVIIARQYIIPDIMANYGNERLIRLSDAVIRHIAKYYCADSGARDLKHNIEFIIRRIIATRKSERIKWVSAKDADRILQPVVQDKQGIFFNIHRAEYSEVVASEIKRCLSKITASAKPSADRFGIEKERERLDYLLSCRADPQTHTEVFDPVVFKETIHKDIYGNDDTIDEVTRLFYALSLKGDLQCTNLALCGGFGVGKTTIVKNIADALGYNYVKISLNGLSDIKELRGFPKTYIGSGPGRIIKAVKKAGSFKTVFLLDEIDKIRPDMATGLVDLLDRSYVDNFLEVPVDFESALFIATANDWSMVPAVIKDRFIVVDVNGYSRSEKATIVSNYIIPKIERGFAARNISIILDTNAKDCLLKTYCRSFGIRDVEQSIQQIINEKLLEYDVRGYHTHIYIRICKEDVIKVLGQEPVARGNFLLDRCQPGVSKALAVSNGILGNAFAIETVLIDGNETLEITGLPRESAIDSVKIAVSCIKKMYPGLLDGKHLHVHFGEGSVPKDGPSAGVALFMSIYSAAIEKPLAIKEPYDIAFTGEISLTGGIFAVGGVYEKIQAAADSGCCKVFIPGQNYERLDQDIIKSFGCKVVPVNHISQVVQAVFN